jgi:hypothetical protein
VRAATALPLAGLALVLGLPFGEAALAVPGLEAGLLFLAPLGLLLAVLALGRYPGERALGAAASWWADRRRIRPRRATPSLRLPPRPRTARPGLILASGLAVRPPPRA